LLKYNATVQSVTHSGQKPMLEHKGKSDIHFPTNVGRRRVKMKVWLNDPLYLRVWGTEVSEKLPQG